MARYEYGPPPHFDAPSVARVYDCWLGGKGNFAADRADAGQIERIYPGYRAMAQANREFISRASPGRTAGDRPVHRPRLRAPGIPGRPRERPRSAPPRPRRLRGQRPDGCRPRRGSAGYRCLRIVRFATRRAPGGISPDCRVHTPSPPGPSVALVVKTGPEEETLRRS